MIRHFLRAAFRLRLLLGFGSRARSRLSSLAGGRYQSGYVPQPLAPSPAVARSSVRSEEDKNEDESEREENEESSDREDGDGSSPSDPVSSLSGAAVVTQETQVAPRIPRAAGRRETGQATEADRRVRSGREEAEEAQMKDGKGNTSRRSSDDPQRYVQGSMNFGSVKAGDLPSKEPHQKETWKKRQTLGTSGATDESKTSNLGSEPVNATEDNQQNSGSHINPRFCLTSDLSADAESGASSETETETQADEHSQSQGQGVFSADVVVGPLIVVKCSETRECFTIEEVRGAIWAWISEHVPELAARAHAGFDVVWKNAVQESVAPLLQSFPGELYLKARPAIVVPQGHEQTTEPTDE
ncbi:hypothetical protein TGRUB_240285 [Toxoplasma gondii RUB]|uniref:Uncharacterized protein n=2 Tax=Toxoplasma gondii TaxID=5811 RepID=A0A086LSW7_TOXGO|nr:hypothetical protein TGRUB_240285 [Toxoplasma gondii RUB]KFH04297.1 hypothetical protein TGVAND_240285 [Toxoplasma gondii VAND]